MRSGAAAGTSDQPVARDDRCCCFPPSMHAVSAEHSSSWCLSTSSAHLFPYLDPIIVAFVIVVAVPPVDEGKLQLLLFLLARTSHNKDKDLPLTTAITTTTTMTTSTTTMDLISYTLSFTTTSLCLFLKLPQILTVINKGSCEGISRSSLMMEFWR